MKNYIIRRILQVIPVIFVILTIVFILLYISGDPVLLMLPEDATDEQVESLKSALNLDKPFHIQFLTFMGNAIQGDFGNSFKFNQSAFSLVIERLPSTLQLGLASIIFASILGVFSGILSAVRKGSFLETTITSLSVLAKGMPNFWLGIMLILFFSVTLKWLPVSGSDGFKYIILPAVTLGTSMAANIARITRSSMLEALSEDYVRTSESLGLGKFKTTFFVFKNTLTPIITVTMLQASSIVGGAIITEAIFAWPGIGQLLIDSINSRDMAVVQASIFIISLMIIFINLVTDIITGLLDPRIKY